MTDIFDRDPSAMQPPWQERYTGDSSTVVPFPRAVSTTNEPPPLPSTYAPTPTETRSEPAPEAPPRPPDASEANSVVADDPMRPVPRSSYATTILGETLADLIDEMHDQYRELSEDEPGGSTEVDEASPKHRDDAVAPAEASDAASHYDLEAVLDIDSLDSEAAAEGLVPQSSASPEEVQAAFSGGTEGDELSRIVRTLEANVRQHIKSVGDSQRRHLEEELASRTAKIKQAAIAEIRRRSEEIRRRYEARNEHREKVLRRNYEKLIRLANKIARQKAEIRQAKHELEEKLKTATQLHQEVDAIRNLLNQHIGILDGLDQARDTSRRA